MIDTTTYDINKTSVDVVQYESRSNPGSVSQTWWPKQFNVVWNLV